MVPANDILGRKNEIKDCIAAANVVDAIKRLIDFMREFQPVMEDEAVLISMEFTELEKELRLQILERKDAQMSKRQIAYRILTTLNEAYTKSKRA